MRKPEMVNFQILSCRKKMLYPKDLGETLLLVELSHSNTETLKHWTAVSQSPALLDDFGEPLYSSSALRLNDHSSTCSSVGLQKGLLHLVCSSVQ